MEGRPGQQSIGCEVSSCKYYRDNACNLRGIVVKPCNNCSNGNPEDETLCGSYEAK